MNFKPLEIKEFPYNDNFLVYSDGRIFDKKRNQFIKPSITRRGYEIVTLQGEIYGVHKVIAITFIPNPNNFSQINHKDTVKNHNFTENLEWCTPKYNMNYENYLIDKITKEELDSYNTEEYNVKEYKKIKVNRQQIEFVKQLLKENNIDFAMTL